MHNSGASRREIEELHLVVIASEAKQSILSSRLHGLLRFARNDGWDRRGCLTDSRYGAIPDVPIAEPLHPFLP
jgi:hypothetical protein